MGYTSRLTGTLVFTPALTDDLVNALKSELPDLTYGGEFDNNTWDAGWGDSGKFYDLDTETVELVATLRTRGIDVTGTIQVVGEESGDIHRYVFTPGKVVHERAKTVWPDGTEFEL
jgi:hypothetical protein